MKTHHLFLLCLLLVDQSSAVSLRTRKSPPNDLRPSLHELYESESTIEDLPEQSDNFVQEADNDSSRSESYDSIRDAVKVVALQGGYEWSDLESYQSKAISWLEGDHWSLYLFSEHQYRRIQQRYALACIYFATNAVRTIYTVEEPRGWIDETNWLQGTECLWYGITCNQNYEVDQIVLASNRLTGSFPPETAIMASSVTTIDLFRNSVYNTGDAGHDWLGEMTNLQRLWHGQSNFEYMGIPPQIGKLTNLIEYDCSYNLYYGPLEGSTFAPLQNLEYLVLSGQYYDSSIPVEIGQLPKLEFLYVQNAEVVGDLSFMEPMESIIECWVDQNPRLGGSIPTYIGSLNTLKSWGISKCGLTGTIPTELGNLRDLVQLWVYDNKLTGTVPIELGNLFKLRRLEIMNNLLTGSMPQDICLNRDTAGGLLYVLEVDCGNTPPEVECDCCTYCHIPTMEPTYMVEPEPTLTIPTQPSSPYEGTVLPTTTPTPLPTVRPTSLGASSTPAPNDSDNESDENESNEPCNLSILSLWKAANQYFRNTAAILGFNG